MLIYVSAELEDIKVELEKRGYTIVNKTSEMPFDAIICNLKEGGLNNYNMQNNIKREGTLIIDIGSKTIDEIEYILNNRVSSSLL